MSWVRGIKEVRHVHVATDGAAVGMKRGPVMTKVQRTTVELPPDVIERVVGGTFLFLPEHTGAGPCGTLARGQEGRSPLAWSIKHLVEPLAAYYATYVPPMHFGAKTGPRGRRAA